MRFLLADELPLTSAQSSSARSPRWQKAPLKSFITLRGPVGRYARCRRKHRPRFYLLLADDSSDIARNHEHRQFHDMTSGNQGHRFRGGILLWNKGRMSRTPGYFLATNTWMLCVDKKRL